MTPNELYRYKATVDAEGDLKSVGIRLYCDCGYRFNEATVDGASSFAQNCYRNILRDKINRSRSRGRFCEMFFCEFPSLPRQNGTRQ